MKKFAFVLAAVLFVFVATHAAEANTQFSPEISSVSPLSAKDGNVVTVNGTFLVSGSVVILSQDGIVKATSSAENTSNTGKRLQFTVGNNVPAGTYDLNVTSVFGTSTKKVSFKVVATPVSLTPGDIFFGGMYGYAETKDVPRMLLKNPYAQNGKCPTGYSASDFVGTFNVDWSAGFCYKKADSSAPVADFGGMYGYGQENGKSKLYGNPYTNNSASCPSGFTATKLLGVKGVDYDLYACMRSHVSDSSSHQFGGLYSAGHPNLLADKKMACAAGFTKSTVHGTSGVDYSVSLCTK